MHLMLMGMKQCQQHGLFVFLFPSLYLFNFCVVCGGSLSKVMVVRKFYAAFSNRTGVISLFVFISIIILLIFFHCGAEEVVSRTDGQANGLPYRIARYAVLGNALHRVGATTLGDRPFQKQSRSTISRQSPLRECSHDCAGAVGLPVFFLSLFLALLAFLLFLLPLAFGCPPLGALR